MSRHAVTILGFAVLLGASGATVMAGPGMKRNIVGVIASIKRQASPTLEITTSGHQARQVHTDAKTEYVKWITHNKSEGQDTHADDTALVVGRCVDVEPRTGDPASAKIVRISEEPAGSAFDPCKDRR